MAPRQGVASPPPLECNVLIGQKGHKTKEERGKRKEKEKDGKKYKSNNIYNHSNATTRGEYAQCQQDSSGQNRPTINTGPDTTPKNTRGEGTILEANQHPI